MTATENLEKIRTGGLVPGASKGFGAPPQGGYDPESTYVVDDPSLYKGDTAPGNVGVVSARPPTSDTNFPHSRDFTQHGAGSFQGGVPPLREAMTGEERSADQPYSFTLPMSPRTREGARRLLRATQGDDVSPDTAARRVGGMVRSRYPLYFADDALLEVSPARRRSSSSERPASHRPLLPDLSPTPARRSSSGSLSPRGSSLEASGTSPDTRRTRAASGSADVFKANPRDSDEPK